jgi:NTE family protein
MSHVDSVLRIIGSRRIGVAFSGGAVRGLAHIGVIKGLSEYGIRPAIVAGTSAGSLIGAALAAGLDWRQLASLACSVFWPGLLHKKTLETFCRGNLPATFAQLYLPFAAVGTALPTKKPVVITQGKLAPALSASCAMRILRRPVMHQGRRLKDGGIACVLPSRICRQLGADFVIASDVWELSSVLRRIGVVPTHPLGRRLYPPHYLVAVRHSDLLIQPSIPALGIVPSRASVEHMIAAGEEATHKALSRLSRTGKVPSLSRIMAPMKLRPSR